MSKSSGYSLFIDESGEAGIKKIKGGGKSGASPYMVLGAALICNDDLEGVRKHISDVANSVGKSDIHCNKLNHRQKKYVCRSMANVPAVFFGLISKKTTLGWYKDKIDGNHAMYYNKCASYLLEIVGKYQLEKGIPPESLDIIFEEGGFDYPKLRSLIARSIRTPFHPNAANLRGIDPYKIVSMEKGEEPLLELADVVAHALYKCCDKSERMYEIPEPQYLSEILDKFYHDPKSKHVCNHGIKPIHDVRKLGLDDDVVAIIERNFHSAPK